eukprot:TRINITY_DN8452_c0_g1_i1.p1 TRINITY_DN8452_c0_g1~~TRINITY_DN8452_c0_g1_i1.p1  ORF type:complete len:275 (-),score=137.64 TRINITY_DN8452_c0_g1_i1:27-851(-)
MAPRILSLALFIFNVIYFGIISPLLSTLIMFPIAWLKGEVKAPNRCSNYYHMHANALYFGVKVKVLAGELKTDERTLYLINHRTWADFFVHRLITDTTAAHLSRNLVGAVFPLIWLFSKLDDSIWFFNNNNVRNTDLFYKILDNHFKTTQLRSLIVYPEGARNRTNKPFGLRRGVIYYAFTRSIPSQIIITKGYENILNEFEFTSSFGQTVETFFGPTIRPSDFETREDFFDEVQKQFVATWNRVYETSWTVDEVEIDKNTASRFIKTKTAKTD